MTALTTQSQLTAATAMAMSSLVASAIQQLNADEQSMMQQMAAFASTVQNPPAPAFQVPLQAPPISQISIPAIQGGGMHGRRGNNFGGYQGCGGCNPRTSFANYTARNALGGMTSVAMARGFTSAGGRGGVGVRGVSHSNTIKQYANMNACFSCGFDVEDRHRSNICPLHWSRPNHEEGYNQSNAQAYINAGYDACTKAMHKTQYLNF
jgi:hypothetical protein